MLCIDDDPAVGELVREILEPEGYQVLVDTGRNMHHILRRDGDFGLVLIDENLKWMWGSDLCLEIKQSDDLNLLPVVLLSGAEDLAKIKDRCGADAYLKKPFELEDLVEIVNEFYLLEKEDLL